MFRYVDANTAEISKVAKSREIVSWCPVYHLTVFLKMYLFLQPLKHRRTKGREAKKAHPHADLLLGELSNCD
jgi:hypothetical protein